MKFLVVGLAVVGMVASACDSDSPEAVTPAPTSTVVAPAEPTPSAIPDVTQRPVEGTTCELAQRFVSAWRAKDVDALMALARPLTTTCPVPRPSGLGGPYPLCDDATVDGEMREGFVWSSGSHGGLESEAELRDRLELFLSRSSEVLSIGCRITHTGCDDSFVVVLGEPSAVGTPGVLLDAAFGREGMGEVGLIGVPVVLGLGKCATPTDGHRCERVLGGTAAGPGYQYWGDESQLPRPLPEWTFFRWTP